MFATVTRGRLIRFDALLLGLLTLHGLDHELRQPRATPPIVSVVGTLEFSLGLWARWLAPDWGPLSQP
jgi:hypothetical protein